MAKFVIDGVQIAEMLIRLGVYDEEELSRYVPISDKMKYKLWCLSNSWLFIFPEKFIRWLYKRHIDKKPESE